MSQSKTRRYYMKIGLEMSLVTAAAGYRAALKTWKDQVDIASEQENAFEAVSAITLPLRTAEENLIGTALALADHLKAQENPAS